MSADLLSHISFPLARLRLSVVIEPRKLILPFTQDFLPILSHNQFTKLANPQKRLILLTLTLLLVRLSMSLKLEATSISARRKFPAKWSLIVAPAPILHYHRGL